MTEIEEITKRIGKKQAKLDSIEGRYKIILNKLTKKYDTLNKGLINKYENFKSNVKGTIKSYSNNIKKLNSLEKTETDELLNKAKKDRVNLDKIYKNTKTKLNDDIQILKKRLEELLKKQNEERLRQSMKRLKKFKRNVKIGLIITPAIIAGLIYAAYKIQKREEDERLKRLEKEDNYEV